MAPDNPSTASERGHLQGPGNAPVTLVEYGDFQCPACGQMYGALKHLQAEFGYQLDFVFKNFPLIEIHDRAMPAAQAAEAAARQGRFWVMHDLLFQAEGKLGADALLRHAQEAGLDLDRFAADFSHRLVMAQIERDINQGQENGVTATPTFFINGQRYRGELSEPALRAALRVELNRKDVPSSKGAPSR